MSSLIIVALEAYSDMSLFVFINHREKAGTLGTVPLVNPIYSVYSGYLLGISPFKGLLGGFKQLGYHPKRTIIFPMNQKFWNISVDTFQVQTLNHAEKKLGLTFK